MKTMEWTFLDKKRWPAGPWVNEPDKVQWPDPKTGLACLAVRGPVGTWCGYVGVAPGHPFYAIDYSGCPQHCKEDAEYYGHCEHCPESVIEVHGGLTFSGFCQEKEKPKGICHIPEPGEEPKIWWLGFDCAHFMDYCPKIDFDLGRITRYPGEPGGVYRTLDYVRAQNAKLAAQLAAMESPKPIRKFREDQP